MVEGAAQTMRLDRLLVYLRFARTRAAARALIESRALRRNRNHVRRVAENVAIGDVLTLPVGGEVRVVEVLSLPERRTSPALARCHYRVLDPRGEIAIAPDQTPPNDMKAPQ
ncbi:S4 domain-containing protein [Erythrobacter sp. HL-111]|uniref:S4 domain-containing protein n=1 Tax=Erythrobacter sp. HL-111 TaxID=1798193 RepID=UPI0006DB8E7C|nr:S4 domain-containing protein [Erythrobacter sp. HL-111]KPP90626.1 MAG: ribosome-associated heat shock protein Hsp15 HslR [Erythrobacteraceae bacterium HL-111]SDS74589.1 ribosome-associated heat shock protein Hsp15 [Erythrobacter sp. HL-111]